MDEERSVVPRVRAVAQDERRAADVAGNVDQTRDVREVVRERDDRRWVACEDAPREPRPDRRVGRRKGRQAPVERRSKCHLDLVYDGLNAVARAHAREGRCDASSPYRLRVARQRRCTEDGLPARQQATGGRLPRVEFVGEPYVSAVQVERDGSRESEVLGAYGGRRWPRLVVCAPASACDALVDALELKISRSRSGSSSRKPDVPPLLLT